MICSRRCPLTSSTTVASRRAQGAVTRSAYQQSRIAALRVDDISEAAGVKVTSDRGAETTDTYFSLFMEATKSTSLPPHPSSPSNPSSSSVSVALGVSQIPSSLASSSSSSSRPSVPAGADATAAVQGAGAASDTTKAGRVRRFLQWLVKRLISK